MTLEISNREAFRQVVQQLPGEFKSSVVVLRKEAGDLADKIKLLQEGKLTLTVETGHEIKFSAAVGPAPEPEAFAADLTSIRCALAERMFDSATSKLAGRSPNVVKALDHLIAKADHDNNSLIPTDFDTFLAKVENNTIKTDADKLKANREALERLVKKNHNEWQEAIKECRSNLGNTDAELEAAITEFFTTVLPEKKDWTSEISKANKYVGSKELNVKTAVEALLNEIEGFLPPAQSGDTPSVSDIPSPPPPPPLHLSGTKLPGAAEAPKGPVAESRSKPVPVVTLESDDEEDAPALAADPAALPTVNQAPKYPVLPSAALPLADPKPAVQQADPNLAAQPADPAPAAPAPLPADPKAAAPAADPKAAAPAADPKAAAPAADPKAAPAADPKAAPAADPKAAPAVTDKPAAEPAKPAPKADEPWYKRFVNSPWTFIKTTVTDFWNWLTGLFSSKKPETK